MRRFIHRLSPTSSTLQTTRTRERRFWRRRSVCSWHCSSACISLALIASSNALPTSRTRVALRKTLPFSCSKAQLSSFRCFPTDLQSWQRVLYIWPASFALARSHGATEWHPLRPYRKRHCATVRRKSTNWFCFATWTIRTNFAPSSTNSLPRSTEASLPRSSTECNKKNLLHQRLMALLCAQKL